MITFGRPDSWYEDLEKIRTTDAYLFKVGICILNDDEVMAVRWLRNKFGYGMMDCKRMVHEIKNTYSTQQLKGILKYIQKHNPEYTI